MADYKLPDTTHIGSANFIVADLQRALDFYAGSLGFHEIGREGDTAILSADHKTPHILLTENREAHAKPRQSTGLYHVAIRYPTRTALARAFQRLIAVRYQFGGFSDHAVSEALYLSDPDGNGLEMYTDRPRDQWPRTNGVIAMVSEALDVDDLLDQAALDSSPWEATDVGTDIGHVHLHVSNLNTAKHFYVDLLGLELAVDWSQNGALFVAAGGYHHHLGLNTWAGRIPPPANSVGLRTFQLVISDGQALEEAAARIEAAGFTVEPQTNGIRVYDTDKNAVDLVTEQR